MLAFSVSMPIFAILCFETLSNFENVYITTFIFMYIAYNQIDKIQIKLHYNYI